MFEKKRGKRFLASVMALVMLLSLAPVGALAAKEDKEDKGSLEGAVSSAEFEAVKITTDLTGVSNNGFTKAYAMWTDTDGKYYLAIASVEQSQKIDKNFQDEIKGKFENPASYINNSGTLSVQCGDKGFNNTTPGSVTGKDSDTWVILVMTKEELKGLSYNNGTFNLGLSAKGFDLGNITINDEAFKGTVDGDVDGDVNPQPTPDGSDEDTSDNWKKTSDRILVAVYDGEQGTWPNEPTISDKGYAFMRQSNNVVEYDGAVADRVFWNNTENQYIDTNVFFSNLESEKKDTGGNWFAYVGGYAENTGITGDASFWSTGAYDTFEGFKTQIIQKYLDNKGKNDNANNYDLLIYTVKYEEYYQPNQSGGGHTLYNAGATGFHIDCAVIPKEAKKVIYMANLPTGCNFVSGVGMPNQVSRVALRLRA